MIEAMLLTICILGSGSAIAYLKADSDYNRDMKKIFGDEHEFSLMDTPFLSSLPEHRTKKHRTKKRGRPRKQA